MKARVIDTGVELEVQPVDKQARYIGSDGVVYWEEDLDFGIEDKSNPDYWTRLEHTYAGMAMQAMITDPALINVYSEDGKIAMKSFVESATDICYDLAHALVEKYKKEEK